MKLGISVGGVLGTDEAVVNVGTGGRGFGMTLGTGGGEVETAAFGGEGAAWRDSGGVAGVVGCDGIGIEVVACWGGGPVWG